MKKNILYSTVFLTLLLLTSSVKANEGVVQMESIDGTNAKCFSVSTLLADFNYKILVNCRGLKYPISQDLFQYVMWADHGDNRPSRLGTLGVGKREFVSTKPYSRLFVTKESGTEPREPSTNLFMSGGVAPIAYLEGSGVEVVSPTPTPTTSIDQVDTPVVDQEPASTMGIGSVIRVLGIVVVVVLVLIVVIAFVSASRRRPMDI